MCIAVVVKYNGKSYRGRRWRGWGRWLSKKHR